MVSLANVLQHLEPSSYAAHQLPEWAQAIDQELAAL